MFNISSFVPSVCLKYSQVLKKDNPHAACGSGVWSLQ